MRILFNHNIAGAADVIDLMRRARPSVHIIATHERIDTPIRSMVDVFLPEPIEMRALTPAAYSDWLLSIAVDYRADLVIPYRRRNDLAEFKDKFKANGIRLLTPANQGTMNLLEDKPSFLTRMEQAGVKITPFRVFAGLDEYKALRQVPFLFADHPGLLCVKPAFGIYGAGFRIIRDDQPILEHLSELSSLELPDAVFRSLLSFLPKSESMMLMPFMPGPERSVDFACYDGRLLGTVTRMKASSTSQQIYHDLYAEELAGLIVGTFGLTGILNLQTIEDATGSQRLLEVNSRASGGIGMTGLTNVNLPALLLNAIDGVFPNKPERVDAGLLVGRREQFWTV